MTKSAVIDKDFTILYNILKKHWPQFHYTCCQNYNDAQKSILSVQYDIFILDGNTAGAAGIAEMLVQGHEGYIEFLPCLPEQWSVGTYKGLCVKGGAEVSAAWNQSLINEATLKATADNTFTVKVPQGKNYTIMLNNKRINPVINNGLITVSMKAKDILKFK